MPTNDIFKGRVARQTYECRLPEIEISTLVADAQARQLELQYRCS